MTHSNGNEQIDLLLERIEELEAKVRTMSYIVDFYKETIPKKYLKGIVNDGEDPFIRSKTYFTPVDPKEYEKCKRRMNAILAERKKMEEYTMEMRRKYGTTDYDPTRDLTPKTPAPSSSTSEESDLSQP